MSTGNAFTFHIPYSTPFTDEPMYRTRIYAAWLVKCKDSGSLAPSWEVFRDAAIANEDQPSARKHKQMPMQVSTVKPINGLSQQARDQLAKAPKSITINNTDEATWRRNNARANI